MEGVDEKGVEWYGEEGGAALLMVKRWKEMTSPSSSFLHLRLKRGSYRVKSYRSMHVKGRTTAVIFVRVLCVWEQGAATAR